MDGIQDSLPGRVTVKAVAFRLQMRDHRHHAGILRRNMHRHDARIPSVACCFRQDSLAVLAIPPVWNKASFGPIIYALIKDETMEFSPAFALLAKFNVGLHTAAKKEEEITAVSQYLGIDVSNASRDNRITMLAEELSLQNGFLSAELENESIFSSEEYRKSLFVREIVANNRINRQNRFDR